jgi:hypothetical protein
MQKPIKQITQLEFKQSENSLRSVDLFHSEFGFEPFLVFTEFHMDRPVFGPHPHAGVSVMTYMLPDSSGSFLNRDSLGDHSIIEPGGVHVTQAGSGIKHDEVPAITGTDCHGFQIWINHADEDRLVAPKAFHAFAKDIPEYKTDSVLLRVVQGEYAGLKSTIELVTKTTLFDITLSPNNSIELDAMEMSFVYLLSGSLTIDKEVAAGRSIITFQKTGSMVSVSTTDQSANFLFVSGTPHHEPIVYGGPFVMTTQEQMMETQRRLQRGEMGILKPL